MKVNFVLKKKISLNKKISCSDDSFVRTKIYADVLYSKRFFGHLGAVLGKLMESHFPSTS